MVYSNERGSIIDAQEELVNFIKIPIYSAVINGLEYWADEPYKLHLLKRVLDVTYGVKINRPKEEFKVNPHRRNG